MEYTGKTIMILGAGSLQVPILQRAKEKGLRVIAVTPDLSQPGTLYADEVVKADVKDEKTILKAAKEYNIDGITTDQTDIPVRTAAYVAEKLGLPGIGYDVSLLFTDKYRMRQKCREIGVKYPSYALIEKPSDAYEFVNKYGFPVMVKPVDSQASHGITKIYSKDELQSAFNKATNYARGGIIIEQWINGHEFSVDSYVIDEKCFVLSVGQYHPFSKEELFSSYETVFPANVPKETIQLIEETNKKVVEGFGLKEGRTHAEYIVAQNGCYLVEIAARGEVASNKTVSKQY